MLRFIETSVPPYRQPVPTDRLRFATSRPLPLLLSAALLLSTAQGCGSSVRRGDPDLLMRIVLAPSAPRVGHARVVVTVSRASWAPVNGARVSLSAVPPDSAAPRTPLRALGQGVGRYVIDAFAFDRPGAWTLTARAEIAGRWSEVERRVAVAPASPE